MAGLHILESVNAHGRPHNLAYSFTFEAPDLFFHTELKKI